MFCLKELLITKGVRRDAAPSLPSRERGLKSFNCKRYLCSQGLKNCEKESDKFLLEYEIMMGLKDISLSVAEYMTFYHVPDFSLSHIQGECLKLYLPRDGLTDDIFSLLRDLSLC